MRALTRHFAIAATLMSVLTGTAFAETPWQQAHPRREEVNQRLANQNRRIHQDVKDGEMSHAQAARLHRDDRKIRQEERDMAAQDHGHITKSEQHVLNQQENAVSNKIGQ
ncbi:hypothetical protein GQ57_23825 [Burkholderia sp. MSh2]|uniref:Lipoprotein n=1 Tax=Burkholderia paludis TaxID=1506587 RepID=A0A6J5DFN6_9BURK|nr:MULTISPECIES: hypothetical protein [Burkholderia]KEZ03495.1 hypothetical protein GQ57_23825 [Burkholderia sp. MSh2]KFG95386.1 hypothetical protein GQ56_0120980 [Burkholderia paludis]CAB3752227.1 hypothetical protein LMG30113_01702 [Burkholderia paludis]VWB48361.1 lipoprotein [Burkholderia paludis]